MGETILVMNFGSTSSKIAVFDGTENRFGRTIRYDGELLRENRTPELQYDFRRESVYESLQEADYEIKDFDAVICRAGVLKPLESGVYFIDDAVIADAFDPDISARGLQCISLRMAKEIADEYGIPAYMCDPVSTDELIDVARVTGLREIERPSAFHALNQKRIGRRTAEAIGRPYEDLNLIGVHMGGGTSVVAHRKGRCIDMFACADEGNFCMDRPGTLPNRGLVNLCFSGLSRDEVMAKLLKGAGMTSLLGTSDFQEVEARVTAGDAEADLAFRAMAYQMAKCVGDMAAALAFDVDAIFLTGGIAYSDRFVAELRQYIDKLAPIYRFPGEDEMQALAENACAALHGEREVKTY